MKLHGLQYTYIPFDTRGLTLHNHDGWVRSSVLMSVWYGFGTAGEKLNIIIIIFLLSNGLLNKLIALYFK